MAKKIVSMLFKSFNKNQNEKEQKVHINEHDNKLMNYTNQLLINNSMKINNFRTIYCNFK